MMHHQDFDRLLDSIRETQPDAEALRSAAERVREKLAAGTVPSLCAGLRADFGAYGAGTLEEARRVLVADHLRTCVACRQEYSGTAHTPVVVPIRRTAGRRVALWAGAAAAAVALTLAAAPLLDQALAPSGPRGTVASLEGTLVLVADQGTTPLAVGAEIAEGREIRSGKDSRAVIALRDGSRVEMNERSDLSLTELWRSKTVHLRRGNVMVEAAKQGSGRLEVATADCLVTVKGTIFGVSRGLKGSRVSVVEGAVQVDQSNGASELLKPGEQATTHQSMQRTTVASDVAWSQNAGKYLALLADLDAIHREIARIPLPGLRYSSQLLDRVPAGSVFVGAIPNLGETLAEATRIFDQHAQESPALSEWWNGEGSKVRAAIDRVREISDYLGEEIMVAGGDQGNPILLAEVRRAGLPERLAELGFPGPVALEGNLIAVGATAVPPVGSFGSTAFGARILESYNAGVGLLFAANMEQIVSGNVATSNVSNPASIAGVDNLRFLVAESKTNLGARENTASLTFAGERHGLAGWLAGPGPMGTLEFVSPEASFAAAFVTRDPRLLLEELLAAAGDGAGQFMNTFQSQTGVNPLDDVAGSLGGEATIAVDGALLPLPSWKVAVEVESPMRLQAAVEAIVASAQRDLPQAGVALASETVENRTYYSLTGTQLPIAVHYTYVDGYLLAGASRPLLMSAITNREAALTLPRSTKFRDQLPLDGHSNFSGLLYYNLGGTVGPLADQLKASGLLTPEQESSIAAFTANREPSLVYVYGEPDRIRVGSRSGLFDVGMQAISGLLSGHPTLGFLPVLNMGGSQ